VVDANTYFLGGLLKLGIPYFFHLLGGCLVDWGNLDDTGK